VGRNRSAEQEEFQVSQMDRRRALSLFAGLGAAGFAAACGSDSNADDTAVPQSDIPVKIGLLVPQTGGLKTIGDDIANGFQLYLDLHQKRLGGHPVILHTADEGETPKSGKEGLNQLLGKGVDAVTGVVNSAVMLEIRDAIRDAKVPLVASNASPAALQGQVYIWRTSFVDNEIGKAMGAYLTREGQGKVAVVTPNSQLGKDVDDGFRDGFSKLNSRLITNRILAGADPSPGKGYFAATLDAIKTSGAESVFCFFAGPAAVEFVKAYRAANVEARLYGGGFLTEGRVLTELGNDARGIRTALNYSADLPNAANRTFAAAYRKLHGASPTAFAMASYDAAQALDRAIVLAGENPTALEINRQLGKVGQIDSPRGVWQFNQSRTPQQKWYLREVKEDGQVLSNVLISELTTLG
jgi:branched-chain amino acid transport system substrate-binding protein